MLWRFFFQKQKTNRNLDTVSIHFDYLTELAHLTHQWVRAKRRNSGALAMGLRLSRTNPSTCQSQNRTHTMRAWLCCALFYFDHSWWICLDYTSIFCRATSLALALALVMATYGPRATEVTMKYRQTSNIKRTKSQKLKCFSSRLAVVDAQHTEARC